MCQIQNILKDFISLRFHLYLAWTVHVFHLQKCYIWLLLSRWNSFWQDWCVLICLSLHCHFHYLHQATAGFGYGTNFKIYKPSFLIFLITYKSAHLACHVQTYTLHRGSELRICRKNSISFVRMKEKT